MKIIFEKPLANNVFAAEVRTEFTDQEQELSTKFGEPEINFGGDITTPAYSLPDHYRKINSGLPYTLSMDANGDPDAKAKMNGWISEIKGRLLTSIDALRAKNDDYSGQDVSTV